MITSRATGFALKGLRIVRAKPFGTRQVQNDKTNLIKRLDILMFTIY